MDEKDLEVFRVWVAGRDILSRLFMYRVLHVILTFVMLWLGIVYTGRQDTFLTSPAYSLMVRIAPAHVWGAGALVIAAFGFFTSFATEWRIRSVAAAVLAFAHATMALMFFVGMPNAPGVGLFFGYAVLGVALTHGTTHIGRRLENSLDIVDLPGPLAG